MCLSRGCLDPQERHNAQVITMSDLTAAAADAHVGVLELLENMALRVELNATGAQPQARDEDSVGPTQITDRVLPRPGYADPLRRGLGQITDDAAQRLRPVPPPISRPV